MNLKKTLVLAAFLAAAAVCIWSLEQQRRRAGLWLPEVSSLQIERVDISNNSGAYTLSNTAYKPDGDALKGQADVKAEAVQHWEFVDLKGAEMDGKAVQHLIAGLLQLQLGEELAAPAGMDKSSYGLDRPAAIVKVYHAAGLAEIRFGRKSEYLGQCYAEAAGLPGFYLVPAELFEAAAKAKDDYRDRAPVKFADADLQSIALVTARSNLILERAADASAGWEVAGSTRYQAGAAEVSALLQSLRAMRAARFVEAQPAELEEYGLVRPPIRITLVFRKPSGRAPLEIRLNPLASNDAKANGYFYLSSRGFVYELAAGTMPMLNFAAEAYREGRLFKFPVERAVAARIASKGEAPLELEKTKDGWRVNGKPGSARLVLNFLQNLSGLEADAFVEGEGDLGFADPRLKVTVQITVAERAGASEALGLTVGHKVVSSKVDKTSYYAVGAKRSEPFVISGESLKKIAPREEDLLPGAD